MNPFDTPRLVSAVLVAKWRKTSPALCVTAAFALCASACGKQEATAQGAPLAPPPEPTIKVGTITVVERPMPDFLTLTGDLLAQEESEVAANASGQVRSTPVERGQAVKKGEVLAVLDTRSAALTASAAVAQAQQAQAQQQQAAGDCDRAEKLFQTGAISKAEYDRQATSCSSTRFAAEAAQANRELSVKVVSDGVVRAPFNGVIGERFIHVGQYVQPSTRVASLYTVDPLRLQLTVPEAQASLVKNGMTLEFKVAAHEDRKFEGTVRFVSPNIRRASRDLVVEAVVPNSDGQLRPGMFATIRLLVGERPRPILPKSAVRRDGTTARAFAVSGGRANERILQLGEAQGEVMTVVAGAAAGDVFVSPLTVAVHDGVRVD